MANNILTTRKIANATLAAFAVNAPFVATANRSLTSEFQDRGYKIGETISIRRQNRYIVGDGANAIPQSIQESVENLTINHQYHTLIEYSVKDLTLKIEDFTRMFIQPAVQDIIAQLETDIGRAAERELYMWTGMPGVPLNSFAAVDLAGISLIEQGINLNFGAYLVVNPRDAGTLRQSLLNSFTPILNEEIVRTSALGHLSFFDIFYSQNLPRHIAGEGPRNYPADTLTVNGAVSSGNTLVLAGATASIANYFVPGDLIQIDGVYSVSKIGRKPTGQLMQFVVQSAANSTAGGAVTVLVSPDINANSASPNQNVSNAIPNGAEVETVTSHNINVAYTKDSLDLVCPPLAALQVKECEVVVDDMTGLSLTITQDGDIKAYANYMRLDVLCGFKWHPEYAAKLIS